MKEGWTYKKLGEVCEIFGRIGFRGYTKGDLVDSPKDGAITLSPSNIVNGEMNFKKCSYITWAKYEESPEIMIYPGDILLVKTASVGKTALVKYLPHKATINPQFVVLKNINVNNNYLSYFLKSEKAQKFIWSIAKGAAAQTVSQKNLSELRVPIVDNNEQQRIVARLDAAFAHIDELKANAEKQLSEARALFQKALSKAMEPKEGWEEKKLGEVCNIDYGTRVVRSKDAGSIYPVYGGGGATFKMDTYNREDSMVISRFGMSEQCTRFVKGKFFLNDSGLTLSMKEPCMIQAFMDWEVFSLNNIIYSLGRGAAQKNLDTKALAEIILSYPNSLSEQQRIVARLDSLSENVRKYEEIQQKVIAECDVLKQALLRKVFE